MNNLLEKMPQKCWAYTGLAIWGALSFMLLHKTSYGIDEGAAHALLLIWSITDNVVSPIFTLGVPDFRVLFLAPVGVMWTGQVVPAKVATILVMALAVWALHTWRLQRGETESALLASGLLLISPLLLEQIDKISVAAFLLLTFAWGAWADQNYRASQKAFGGMYFGQLLLCFIAITLHPIGLAYPIALLWAWYKEPVDKRHQKMFFGGIAATILFSLALTSGWNHVSWLGNPVKSLAAVLLGTAEADDFGVFHWIVGGIMTLLLLLVILRQLRFLWEDLLGRTLLIGLVIGLFAGDETFAIVAFTLCLYWGLPVLLHTPDEVQGSFLQQRGLVVALTIFLATTCMISSKLRYQAMELGDMSPRDRLIKMLAEDSGLFAVDDTGKSASKISVKIASQWPGLTMLACRCDALPLPPNAKDSDNLYTMLSGINYLLFDPRDTANHSLSHNLSLMNSEKVETIALQKGGVIVQVKTASEVGKKDDAAPSHGKK